MKRFKIIFVPQWDVTIHLFEGIKILKDGQLQLLEKYTSNKTLIHCKLQCKMIQPFWKTIWHLLMKLKVDQYNVAFYFWLFTQENENICQHEDLYANVYSRFIHNS